MREFASPATRASMLPRAVKLLYTCFCGLTAFGLATCVGLYDDVVGFRLRATPAELYGNLVHYYQRPADPRKLLQTTHFHLFSVPLYLLVVGHLFLLTGRSAKVKSGFIGAAAGFTALHLFAPWAVLLGGRALAWLYPISGAGMLVAFAVLMGVPLFEMWAPRPNAGPDAASSSAR